MTPDEQRKKHNVIVLEKMRGMEARPSTADDDPRNPNEKPSLQMTHDEISADRVEREAWEQFRTRVLTGGNHLALYANKWPAWQLNGLTREQQCESALRRLGVGQDYDLWCCYSAMMQAREELDARIATLGKGDGT